MRSARREGCSSGGMVGGRAGRGTVGVKALGERKGLIDGKGAGALWSQSGSLEELGRCTFGRGGRVCVRF